MKCCDKKPIRYIPSFVGFTAYQPEVPAMYWNVKSQEQRILAIAETLHKLVCYVDCLGEKGNEIRADLDELIEEFNRLKEGGLIDYYEEQLNAWIIEHMPEIISKYVKQVFFGLTLDGHFVAYIPEGSAWEDVIFDTGANYDLDTYGRLMLYYVTDSSSEVWQEEIPDNTLHAKVAQLETRVKHNEDTLYTPIMEGDL